MNRRGFLLGFGAALAAPAIVRAESLMPVRLPSILRPVTIIVDPHGNDANGLGQGPVRTFQRAMDLLTKSGSQHGTVTVNSGTYYDPLVMFPKGEHALSIAPDADVKFWHPTIVSCNERRSVIEIEGGRFELRGGSLRAMEFKPPADVSLCGIITVSGSFGSAA